MPSSLRSNVQPGSLKRFSVSVAAMGVTQSGIFTTAVYPAYVAAGLQTGLRARRGGALGPPEEEGIIGCSRHARDADSARGCRPSDLSHEHDRRGTEVVVTGAP